MHRYSQDVREIATVAWQVPATRFPRNGHPFADILRISFRLCGVMDSELGGGSSLIFIFTWFLASQTTQSGAPCIQAD